MVVLVVAEKNFNIVNIRVSFKNIPIHKIEKYSFKDLEVANESFKKIPDVSECVILQTASRVEVYLVVNLETEDSSDVRRTEGRELTLKKIQDTWESLTELDQFELDHLDQTLEVYRDTDVYRHLLELASGIDSLIIGQEHILDEIKEAISNTKKIQASGHILNKLFDSAIRIATKIRESTGISKAVTSVGDVAVNIADERVGLDGKKKVLLMGTGETGYLVAKSLNRKGCAFSVVSRYIDRAAGFSKTLGGTPIELTDVFADFGKFDIIFVATTATYFVISHDKIKRAMENKKTGTLILDVSDPRAVDEEISSLPGIKLMFRDQIGEMDEENVTARKEIVPSVQKMINDEVPILEATINRLDAEPLVKDITETTDSLREKELKKALEKLGETDEEKIKIIDELTKNIAKNIVPVPVKDSKKTSEPES